MNTIESIIAVLITVFAVITNMYILSPIKFNKKEFFGLMFVAGSLSFILIILGGLSEYLIGIITTLVISGFLYYKTENIIIVLINTVFPISIILVSNYLLANILAIFGVYEYNWFENFPNYLIFSFALVILSSLISLLFNHMLNEELKIIETNLDRKQACLISIFSSLSFGILYFNIFFGNDYYANPILRVTSFLLLLAEFTLTTYIIFYFVKSVKMEEENKRKEALISQMNIYTTEIERLYLTLKEFKHDYKNMLYTMTDFIESRDVEKLQKYFNNNINPYSNIILENSFKLHDLINIKLSPIKSLIASKAVVAQEEKPKVNFMIEVIRPIEKIDIDILDLSRVIGITIDNAIEGARECENPYVRFAMVRNPQAVVFIIKNNYIGTMPDIYELYEKGVSTKGKNRGSGLNSLRNIVTRSDNIRIDVSTREQEFCVTLKVLHIEEEAVNA